MHRPIIGLPIGLVGGGVGLLGRHQGYKITCIGHGAHNVGLREKLVDV